MHTGHPNVSGNCDVRLVASQQYNGRKTINLAIYKEGYGSVFREAEFWLPVFDAQSKRLYVLPSNSETGFKVSFGKSGYGRIVFNNVSLHRNIMKVSPDNAAINRNWCFDQECKQLFVSL